MKTKDDKAGKRRPITKLKARRRKKTLKRKESNKSIEKRGREGEI